jgi:hypothetical protein
MMATAKFTKKELRLLGKWVKELEFVGHGCYANSQKMTSLSDDVLLYHEGFIARGDGNGAKAHAWNSWNGRLIDVAFNNVVVELEFYDSLYHTKLTANRHEIYENFAKHDMCWMWIGDPESYGEIYKPYVAPGERVL